MSGFFRRGRPDPGHNQAVRQNGRSQFSTHDVETAIEEVEQIVLEGLHEAPIAREMLELLQVGLPYLTQRDCSETAVVTGQTVARLGYLTRAAEFAMFEAELEPDADLEQALGAKLDEAERDGLSAWDAMADLAAAITAGESVDSPAEEGGPTWTLPGFDGQIRGRLRDNLLLRVQRPTDISIDDFKRIWKYGYFLCARRPV